MSEPVNHLEARNEVVHAHADHSKAKEIFNFKDFVSLKDGITQMAKWAQEVGARESVKFDNIEIKKKLPTFWVK